MVPADVSIARSSGFDNTTVTPVGRYMSTASPRASTPDASSSSRMNRPKRSSPTTPTRATRSPRRAAPHAKIAPEPPIVSRASSTKRSACPNAGMTSPPRSTRSGFASPSTSTSNSVMAPEPTGSTRREFRQRGAALELTNRRYQAHGSDGELHRTRARDHGTHRRHRHGGDLHDGGVPRSVPAVPRRAHGHQDAPADAGRLATRLEYSDGLLSGD